MKESAVDFKSILSAIHGNLEFDAMGDLILRNLGMKSVDTSGTARVYVDSDGSDVLTGRRFDPMSGIWLLRPGTAYRVITNVEVSDPFRDGLSALVVPTDDAADTLMIVDRPFRSGYFGQVCFTILPYRRVEIEAHTSIARLVFFSSSRRFDVPITDGPKSPRLKREKA